MAYNTVSAVRKNTLVDTFFESGKTGSTLNLNDNYTKAIVEVKKNGTVLDSSAYSFKPPYTLEFTTALVSSDYVEVTRDIMLTDSEVGDIIAEADNLVDSHLARSYTLPLSPVPKVVKTKALHLARSMVIKHLNYHTDFDVSERELETAKEGIAACKAWLTELAEGHYELVNDDGTIVSRKKNYKEKSTGIYVDDSTELV